MPEITDAELRVLARYQNMGTPEEVTKKISDLEGDNHKQREELRQARESAVQVPDGGRVIGKEDAERLDALTALGTPDEVQAKLKAADESAGELATLKRRAAVRAAAEAAGYRPEVLENLPQSAGWTFEVKQEGDGQDKANVAYVRTGKEGEDARKLAEVVEGDAVLKAFLPALKLEHQGEWVVGRSVERFPASPERGEPPRPITPQEIEARKKRHMAYTI